MKLTLVTLVFFAVFLRTALGVFASSCKKRTEMCRGADECCPVAGRRIVCAPHLEICGKKSCCITEVEEQQEKQAAIIRNRNPKLKRVFEFLLDEVDND